MQYGRARRYVEFNLSDPIQRIQRDLTYQIDWPEWVRKKLDEECKKRGLYEKGGVKRGS